MKLHHTQRHHTVKGAVTEKHRKVSRVGKGICYVFFSRTVDIQSPSPLVAQLNKETPVIPTLEKQARVIN